MMASVSLLVVRYRWLLYPALGFLGFIAFRVYSTPGHGTLDMLSPFLIGTGLIFMYQSKEETASGFVYWIGESLVIAMFTYNSIALTPNVASYAGAILGAIGVFSAIAALWFRGKFWNYAIVIGFEAFLAIFVAMAFPIMEIVLEAIINEKLKKVGEKVRAHHDYLEKYYNAKK
jgi:hypothetical protein